MEYQLETYALLKFVDESVLALNPHVTDAEFELIPISILEKEFSGLFGLPRLFHSQRSVRFPNGDQCSQEFYTLLQMSPYFEMEWIGRGYAVVLRSKRSFELKPDAYGKLPTDLKEFTPFQENVRKIVRAMRLSGGGDVESSVIFQVDRSLAFVFMTSFGAKTQRGGKCFDPSDKVVTLFSRLYKGAFSDDWDFSLALENFESAITHYDLRVSFILYITSLECIFNQGRDQIAHTVSRHAALILAADAAEFDLKYLSIKKLYHKRSGLVHGSKTQVTKEDLESTREIVRKCILHCIECGLDKAALFLDLNRLGIT